LIKKDSIHYNPACRLHTALTLRSAMSAILADRGPYWWAKEHRQIDIWAHTPDDVGEPIHPGHRYLIMTAGDRVPIASGTFLGTLDLDEEWKLGERGYWENEREGWTMTLTKG
jgi:hypothetical protein